MQKKQRYYLDTSVWGGFFDVEFEADSILLFNMVNDGAVVCLYTEVVKTELLGAPERVRSFFESLPDDQVEEIKITPEIVKLASMYVNEGVVGKTSFDDCLHIAAATVHKVDVLLSWNFKHIVNVHRIKGYNDINVRFGYPMLEIRQPKAVIYGD